MSEYPHAFTQLGIEDWEDLATLSVQDLFERCNGNFSIATRLYNAYLSRKNDIERRAVADRLKELTSRPVQSRQELQQFYGLLGLGGITRGNIDRNCDVFCSHFMDGDSYSDIARRLDVSRESIRRIVDNDIRRLRHPSRRRIVNSTPFLSLLTHLLTEISGETG